MSLRKPAFASLLTVLVGAISASIVAQAQAPSQRKPAQTAHVLRVYQPEDVVTLDWTLNTHSVDAPVLLNLHEGLFEVNEKGAVVPNLAESWSVSPDQLRYTFKLKRGIRWSDGEPLKAEQFIDAWKRLLSSLTAAPYAYVLFDISGAPEFFTGKAKSFDQVGARALDDRTIEVKLSRPLPSLLSVLTFWVTFPIRQDLLNQHGNLWSKPGNLVGLGAFRLESIEFGERITLVPNRFYYKPRGNIDRLEFVIGHGRSVESLFQSGQIDIAFEKETGKFATSSGALARHSPAIRVKRLIFNADTFPFSSVELRRIFANAIDTTHLVKSPEVDPTETLAPSWLYDGHPAKRKGAQEPKPIGSPLSDSVRESLAKITLLTPLFTEHGSEDMELCDSLKKMLESKLHIPVEIVADSDPATYLIHIRTGQYSILLSDWQADYPDLENFYTAYASYSTQAFRMRSPSFDEALEAARHELSRSKRQMLYRRADDVLTRSEVLVLPLFAPEAIAIVSDRVQGFGGSPFHYKKLGGLSVQ